MPGTANMKLRLPLFILFEGIDGSGKSTLTSRLASYYISQEVPVEQLAEPSGGEWGKKIRSLLQGKQSHTAEEQLTLFIKDREDDVARNIVPALESQKMILLDRYYYSNAAYQGALGIDPERILSENRKLKFPEPDRIYLIDITPETALARINKRNPGNGTEIFEKEQFLKRVREIYLSITNERFCIINGSLTIDEEIAQITADIEKNFIENE